jgi:hypothetical protein
MQRCTFLSQKLRVSQSVLEAQKEPRGAAGALGVPGTPGARGGCGGCGGAIMELAE